VGARRPGKLEIGLEPGKMVGGAYGVDCHNDRASTRAGRRSGTGKLSRFRSSWAEKRKQQDHASGYCPPTKHPKVGVLAGRADVLL
jgi:hypothetical protein